MNGKSAEQVEADEADEIVRGLDTRITAGMSAKACTPEAHAEVVETSKDLCRAAKWQIRHAQTRQATLPAGGDVKVNFLGLFKVSGPTAAAVVSVITGSYRVVLVIVALWAWAKFKGLDPAVLKDQVVQELVRGPAQASIDTAKKIDIP